MQYAMLLLFIFIISDWIMIAPAESINSKPITPKEAVAGIINGMIGSIALMLPTFAIGAGYIGTAIAIISAGLFCGFSSWIYSLHMGDQPDIGYALNDHFKVKLWGKLAYDFFVWLFIIFLCIQYFQLIVKIWECVFFTDVPQFYFLISSVVNGVLMLLLVLLLEKLQFGAKTMVYGIISLVVYLVFLGLILGFENESAPISKDYNPFGGSIFSLMATMTQGFMIQSFLIPFLKKLANEEEERSNFIKYTFMSYGIGGLSYIFIALVGSFGIIHRNSTENPIAVGVLAYFSPQWYIKTISIIYILHISSVYPEYLLISQKIFFENVEKVFRNEKSSFHSKKRHFQKTYIFFIVALCATVAGLQYDIEKLAVINGGFIGGIITFAIPCILHLYCMIFMPQDRRDPYKNQIRSESKKESKRQVLIQEGETSEKKSVESNRGVMEQIYVECKCDHYKTTGCKVFMTIALLIWTGFGIFVSIQSFKDEFM